jgi:hypothetical protein
VLLRTLLLGALALAATKLFWPGKWRQLGERANRLTNAILIAIVLVYSAQLVWLLLHP